MIDRLKEFIEELSATKAVPNVYNQYSYECDENSVRRDNLLIYLKKMYKLKPKVILVGEAPGYRGCRITGVPFTSEYILMKGIGNKGLFGKEAGYRLPSEGERLIKEATATIIWETVLKYDIMPLAWNAFPFHPHREGNEKSNRTPLKSELILGEGPLLRMIEMFNIKKIVAVGGKADQTLRKLNIEAYKVRHPAQGGKNEFVEGIEKIKNSLL
jgi:uracil-DNA glycosylase